MPFRQEKFAGGGRSEVGIQPHPQARRNLQGGLRGRRSGLCTAPRSRGFRILSVNRAGRCQSRGRSRRFSRLSPICARKRSHNDKFRRTNMVRSLPPGGSAVISLRRSLPCVPAKAGRNHRLQKYADQALYWREFDQCRRAAVLWTRSILSPTDGP